MEPHLFAAAGQGGENRDGRVVQAVLADTENGNTSVRRLSRSKPEASALPWKTRGDVRRDWNYNGARIFDGDCSRGVAGHFDRWTAFQEADRPTHVVDFHAVQTFH